MSIISNYSIQNNLVTFQLNNSKGLYKTSFTNALRRILISYLDSYTINFNDIKFLKNDSLFNNEFLKKRLSLIPVFSGNNQNYEFLIISCHKKNDLELIEDVYVSDFKVKDRTTDKELDVKDYFQDLDILFSKLQMNQEIHFEATLKKDNAFYGGATHSVVSSCVVTFHNSNYEKDAVIDRERNYDLNKENDPYIYDFSFENIGFYKSEELIKLACDNFEEKLNDFRSKFDNFIYENNFYYFDIKNENDTLGNVFCKYMLENNDVEYCGYNIVHPLKNNISIKIQINGKKEKLMKLIDETINKLISMIKDIKKEFK